MATISIGSDHAGFLYKEKIIAYLTNLGHKIIDRGTNGPESVDYPDFAHAVASDIEGGKVALGILLCGTANGIAITANKHQIVRAAICWNNEIASLARQHNNANAIAIPARVVSEHLAIEMVETFINTKFEGGRHARRVNKIPCI